MAERLPWVVTMLLLAALVVWSAVGAWRPARRVEATPPPTPTPFVEAHGTIADALDLVAIHCFLGPEWADETFLHSMFPGRVRDGWYSDVVYTDVGHDRPVWRRREDGGLADAFYVSWDAHGERRARCDVEMPSYADVTLVLRDEATGAPLSGVHVSHGGARGRSDRDGVVRLPGVYAGRPTWRVVRCPTGPCAPVTPPGPVLEDGEQRRVAVAVRVCRDEDDTECVDSLDALRDAQRGSISLDWLPTDGLTEEARRLSEERALHGLLDRPDLAFETREVVEASLAERAADRRVRREIRKLLKDLDAVERRLGIDRP